MRIRPRCAVPVVAAIAVLFLLVQGSPAQTGGPTLTVRVAGGGTVTSEPRGIACEPLCSAPYPRTRTGPQVVQLTATPAPGQQLEAWGESCSGVAATCTVVMNTDRVVTARFREAPPPPPAAPPGTANLSVIASAGGSVSGPGIACPADCVEPLALGSSASLSAAAAPVDQVFALLTDAVSLMVVHRFTDPGQVILRCRGRKTDILKLNPLTIAGTTVTRVKFTAVEVDKLTNQKAKEWKG